MNPWLLALLGVGGVAALAGVAYAASQPATPVTPTPTGSSGLLDPLRHPITAPVVLPPSSAPQAPPPPIASEPGEGQSGAGCNSYTQCASNLCINGVCQ